MELWRESLALLRGLSPDRLLLTHYGAFDDPVRHLDELEERLLDWTAIAEKTVADGGSREDLAGALQTLDEKEIAAESLADDIVARYRHLCPMAENSAGLYRYVVKRAGTSRTPVAWPQGARAAVAEESFDHRLVQEKSCTAGGVVHRRSSANTRQNAGWVPGTTLFAAYKVACLRTLSDRIDRADPIAIAIEILRRTLPPICLGASWVGERSTLHAPRPWVKAKSMGWPSGPSPMASHSVTALAKPVFSTAQVRPRSAEVKTPRSVPR